MAEIEDKQLKRLKKLIETAEINVASAKELAAELIGSTEIFKSVDKEDIAPGGKIIEGVYDGQNMVGPGNKVYPVPANYASKSKLVQGDILKLTISEDGSFIYKQIGPIERNKIIGTVVLKDGQYFVEVDDDSYKVLYASVTYFKAQPGDQVTIVVPQDAPADWAAIEAVIR